LENNHGKENHLKKKKQKGINPQITFKILSKKEKNFEKNWGKKKITCKKASYPQEQGRKDQTPDYSLISLLKFRGEGLPQAKDQKRYG